MSQAARGTIVQLGYLVSDVKAGMQHWIDHFGVGPWLHIVYSLVAAVAVVWALRPNIKRLINGTEPRAPKLDLK